MWSTNPWNKTTLHYEQTIAPLAANVLKTDTNKQPFICQTSCILFKNSKRLSITKSTQYSEEPLVTKLSSLSQSQYMCLCRNGCLFRDLSLRFPNFFNKDPGHWIPPCVGVIISISGTITDPESHAHLASVDVVTVPLNIVYAENILSFWFPHVHNTVNWQGSCTFSTVESEIPAFAAIVTAIDSKNTSPVDMEGCVREVLGEHAVLGKIRKMRTSQLF